jgi:NitT/TauT family transport system substrate-binding protein
VQVGLDPRKDVEWVHHSSAEAVTLLGEGKIDAFVGLPPEPQELRARKIGRVLLDTSKDRPWSQYYCCLLAANREFHRKHPVATKRAMRAILKAADLCSQDPAGVARRIVDRGFAVSYEYAHQTTRELNYRAWREFDPGEAVRVYALRLGEAGFIKSTPKRIIAEGTDWRAFTELRKELKA